MTVSIITLVGTFLSGIAIPLFGIWLKNYLAQKAADEAAVARAKQDQIDDQANIAKQVQQGQGVNSSIDNENKAADDWVKNQPKP